jgi:hypothetical protein
MNSFLQRISDEMNLIGEGSHSLLPEKGEWPIAETHTIRPSMTIIRGQNSSAISQRGWKSGDSEFPIGIGNFNGRQPFSKSDDRAHEI